MRVNEASLLLQKGDRDKSFLPCTQGCVRWRKSKLFRAMSLAVLSLVLFALVATVALVRKDAPQGVVAVRFNAKSTAEQTGLKYMYISFHGGARIDKYDLTTGELVGSAIPPGKMQQEQCDSVRMMASHDDSLYFSNSKDDFDGGRIMQYTEICASWGSGQMTIVSDNVLLQHPYAIVFNPEDGLVYSTNQNSGTVTKTDPVTGLTSMFALVPEPRGMCRDSTTGDWYVNSKGLKATLRFNRYGEQVGMPIMVKKPIGLVCDVQNSGMIFISSNDNNSGGVVFVYDPAKDQIPRAFKSPHGGLGHPAGMAIADNVLFVACQNNQQVVAFDISPDGLDGSETHGYLGKVITNLPKVPEGLLLGKC